MTRFYQRVPLGFFEVPPRPDGIAHCAGHRIPGPLGIGIGLLSDSSSVRCSALEEALAESLGVTFTLGSDTYRLRLAARAAWNVNLYEEPVQPNEARSIIEGVIQQRAADFALVNLLKSTVGRLSGLDPQGLVLVRLRPRVFVGGSPEAPPVYSPARPKPQPAPGPPAPVEPVMSAEIAAAQAATLKKAAESGVPFCEECARAANKQLAAANP